MKPTPTDFLGIRFRSRSEAMFALQLSIWAELSEREFQSWAKENRVVKTGTAGFQYEPRTWLDGWTPDFMTWTVEPPRVEMVDRDTEQVRENPYFSIRFIEYKPTRPSQSYIDRFVFNVEQWFWHPHNSLNQHYWHPYQFRIFYGSAYLADRDYNCGEIVVVPSMNRGEGSFIYDSKRDWVDPEVLDYRFDLADGGVACSR
jgi:hypothetical protein